MQKPSLLGYLLTVGLLVWSCRKVKEAANATEGLKNYAEGMKEFASKMGERRAKDDTISIPYADLKKMLPSSISGYTKEGNPKGESMNMVGVYYSTVSQIYKSGNGEITVNIIDYNASYASTVTFATGFVSIMTKNTQKQLI